MYNIAIYRRHIFRNVTKYEQLQTGIEIKKYFSESLTFPVNARSCTIQSLN